MLFHFISTQFILAFSSILLCPNLFLPRFPHKRTNIPFFFSLAFKNSHTTESTTIPLGLTRVSSQARDFLHRNQCHQTMTTKKRVDTGQPDMASDSRRDPAEDTTSRKRKSMCLTPSTHNPLTTRPHPKPHLNPLVTTYSPLLSLLPLFLPAVPTGSNSPRIKYSLDQDIRSRQLPPPPTKPAAVSLRALTPTAPIPMAINTTKATAAATTTAIVIVIIIIHQSSLHAQRRAAS